jgi:hypothetical protein
MSKWFRAHRLQFGLTGLALGVFLLLAVMTLLVTPVAAAPQLQGDKPPDETCLACHQQEDDGPDWDRPFRSPSTAEKTPQCMEQEVACVDCPEHTSFRIPK